MNPEIRKYLEMFIAMATDALLGKITPLTFAQNAQLASEQMLKSLLSTPETPSPDAQTEDKK